MGARPGETRILRALYRDHDGLTFTELKRTTELSSPSLSQYLKALQDKAIIRKNPGTKKYQISEAYVPMDILEKVWGRHYALFVQFSGAALHFGQKLREIKDDNKRKEKYGKLLRFFYHMISFSLWAAIDGSAKQCLEPRRKSQGSEKEDDYSAIQDFMFDFFLPLAKALREVDVDLWEDHKAVEEIIMGEMGKELDKAFKDIAEDPDLMH